MSLLLTNDDGIDAPGLAALTRSVEVLRRPFQVVAPAGPQSGCGHMVTTHRAIVVDPRGEGRWAVHGTPGDCVRLGLNHLAKSTGWVISGINAGGNLGTDIHHSGTVAAVREGAIRGVPGVAVSHYIARGRTIDWDRASMWTWPILEALLARPVTPGTLWNVNLPHLLADDPDPEVVLCPTDPSPLPLDFVHQANGAVYSGDYQNRARLPGHDVEVCFSGRIAISLVLVTASVDPCAL